MLLEIRESQAQAESSWMPTTKSLIWGAVALGTIAAVGALCYSFSFPGAEDQTINTTQHELTECVSPPYLQTLSQTLVDLCSNGSPFHTICDGNLGFARSMMPQLNSSALQSYLMEKASHNISITEESIAPSNLTPAQAELGVKSISSMIDSWKQGIWDPCKDRILSADGYVIDGHHRWAACTLLGRPMTILNIHDSAQHILSELLNYQGVFRLTLGQPNI